MDSDEDVLSSTLIETLYLFCKSKLADTTDLELVDNEDVHNVLESIKLDNVYFVENTDPNVTWSAVIRQFEAYPLLDVSRTNAAVDDIISELSENFKRVYGALLCTAELLIEFCPRNGPVVVQSLYKALVSQVLHGHSNSTSFILNIVQDYKMYFPYAYTFSRRIGRSPHMTLQQWRDCLFPEFSHTDSSHDQPISAADWDMSGLEEGEDSDGEDQKSINDVLIAAHHSPHRRRATRMNTSGARNASRADSRHSGGAGADVLMSAEDSLMEIQDISILSSNDVTSGDRPLSLSPKNQSTFGKGNITRAVAAPPASRFASAVAVAGGNTSEDDDSVSVQRGKGHRSGTGGADDEVTLDDLRAMFDQTLERGSDLAEKRKLARNIEYNTEITGLANSVRRFHDIELSWDELKDLAAPYIAKRSPVRDRKSPQREINVVDDSSRHSRKSPNVLDDIPDIADYNAAERSGQKTRGNESPCPADRSHRTKISDWAEGRVYHNYAVDSVDLLVTSSTLQRESSATGSGKDSANGSPMSQRRQQGGQQSSPYLTLPQPPPHLTVLQVGEHIFREVDRRGTEVISRSQLIQTLRDHPDVTKRLRLPSHIYKEDGSDDNLVGIFRSLDAHGDGDISLDEFLDFLRTNSDEYGSSSLHSVRNSSPEQAAVETPLHSREDFDPVRVSTASDDIIGHSGNRSRRRAGKGGVSRSEVQDITASDRRAESSQSPQVLQPRHMAASYDSTIPVRGVEADNPGRPPLYRSHSVNTAPPQAPAVALSMDGHVDKHSPPPPSELGAAMSVILEGWLEKKSTHLGQWQKRYFVLAFGSSIAMGSSNYLRGYSKNIELRIFKRAVPSAWGNVPLGLTRIIDIKSIEHVETIPNKKKIDTVFKTTERMRTVSGVVGDMDIVDSSAVRSRSPLAGDDGEGVIDVARRDSMDSVCSDAHWEDKCRVTTLRATDPEERLLWVKALRKCQKLVL